jgi:hypothetical protein
MEVEYRVSAGKKVRLITESVILMFALFTVIIPYLIWMQEGMSFSFYLVIALMIAIYIPVLIIAWAGTPQKYIVSDEGIRIKRPIGDIFIPIDKIDDVEEKDFKFTKTIRVFGNGGLFGITGRFWTKEDGTMYFYGRNSNYVMVHADKKYVLSPDDRFQFINHVRKLIERR